jgi:hypothetical protein
VLAHLRCFSHDAFLGTQSDTHPVNHVALMCVACVRHDADISILEGSFFLPSVSDLQYEIEVTMLAPSPDSSSGSSGGGSSGCGSAVARKQFVRASVNLSRYPGEDETCPLQPLVSITGGFN